MAFLPKCLLGPHHVHPGVNTERQYRLAQAKAIRDGQERYQNLEWRQPWLYLGAAPEVIVSGGRWLIRCATPECGNYPSASPEWRLALCYDCGAIYEGLIFPDDIAEIERLLLLRPTLSTRNLLPTDTVAQLERENAEHWIGGVFEAGVPVIEGAR